MKYSEIKRGDGKFYVDTSAGRFSADEVGGLAELAAKVEENQPRPAEFLAAWKEAITLAGEHLFNIQADSVAAATDRDQLQPDHDVITASLGVLSSGEQVYILSIYQFFSDSTVRELCNEFEYAFPSLTDIATLDKPHRSVIAKLIDAYSGW